MNSLNYMTVLLLWVTATLAQTVPPLIPGCPKNVYDTSIDCHPPCKDYSVDPPEDLCISEGKICCYKYDCQYYSCVDPLLLEQCPFNYDIASLSCLDTSCYENNTCNDGEKCCYASCSYCGISDVEGNCPGYDPSNTTCLEESCYWDDICILEGTECCSKGCYYCAIPEPVAVCPWFDYDYNDCYPPCFDNNGKDTCTDGKICCYGQCGQYCAELDYYRVLCPNESILELKEPLERLTSFCIENCECHDFGQICCESPCGCELDICRYPVIQQAVCPDYCSWENDNYHPYCSEDENYCYQNGEICCDCGGQLMCQIPKFIEGPQSLWELNNPEIP